MMPRAFVRAPRKRPERRGQAVAAAVFLFAVLGGNFAGGLHHVLDHFEEILQAGCGDDDVVSTPTDVLGDP